MWDPRLEEVLIAEGVIRERVQALALEISRDYAGKDLVLIGVLKGAVVFLSDLTRMLDVPHVFDFISAASYGSNAESSGEVTITRDVTIDLKGRDILLIEDIYDSGTTLDKLMGLLRLHDPASLEICAFLVKERPRKKEVAVRYSGFAVKEHFVVGYGLDFDQKYRHLKDVWRLRLED